MTTRNHHEIRSATAWLRSIRSRARAALALQRLAHLGAGALALVLLAGLLDYLFRFPAPLRTLALALGVIALVAILLRRITPVVRFNPSLSSIALRVERERPDLRGLLASAVDFAGETRDNHDDRALSSGLAALVVRDAAARWQGSKRPALVNHRPAIFATLRLIAVLAAGVTLFAFQTNLSTIGAQRVLLPWSGAEWPRRTGVVDVTALEVHPRGAAVPLRAALVKTPRDPDDTTVLVLYRATSDTGRAGATRPALLTHPSRAAPVPPDARDRAPSGKGALFERLVEVDAAFVEYRFETSDDATAWKRIRLVEPPAVRAARAEIIPPAYAANLATLAQQAGAAEAVASLAATRTDLDLGAGRDERAIAPPALVGSRVALTLNLNKPLPQPQTIDRGFLASAFGEQIAALPDARLDATPSTWTLSFTLPSTVRIPVSLRDEHNIESPEPAVFRFEAVEDREPSVSITEPPSDMHVLPTATVRVLAEARDDVGLSTLWITLQRFAPEGTPPSGPGGALRPTADPAELTITRAAGVRAAQASSTVDLDALDARPGEEFELLALAMDIRMSTMGAAGAPPSRSQARRLRVITENQFIEELRGELNALRSEAIRAEQQQREVQSQTQTRGSDRVTRRGQSLVGERLSRQREAIQRLNDRIEQNNLADQRIRELLGEANAAVGRAGQAAAGAQRSLDDAAQRRRDELARAGEDLPPAGDESASLNPEQARDTNDAQQEVRDQLSDLIALLDAGEDNWVARRSLERLLEQQRALRTDTAQTGAQTAGASPEQLTPQQRASLQDLAQRQRELAEQTRQTGEELRERAAQLSQNDPDAAAGMQEAARRLEQNRVAETQQQASQNTRDNRTNDANQQQDQAIAALQEALENLERGEDARRDQLRRRLASIIESLQALVAQQRRELDALNANPDAPGLDAGMIALNRNTLGVLDLANAGGRELAGVARLVARASESQVTAITALRARPVDPDAARDAEQRSLASLEEALRESRRIDQNQQAVENQRILAELRQKYRALLEREVTLRARTGEYASIDELTRRQRFEVRSLGEEQVAIADELAAMRRDTAQLAEARIFEFAHERLQTFTNDAASALRDARPADAITPEDRAIATLAMLVQALDDAQRQQNPFDNPAGGDSGAGGANAGQQPTILPIHELKLLRAMQAEVLERTRDAEAARETPARASQRLSREQDELHTLAQELLERIQRQMQGPGGPGGAGGPGPTPTPPAPVVPPAQQQEEAAPDAP